MVRTFRYPSYVKDVRADDTANPMPRRSRLIIELDRPSGSQATFVMMNPSKADNKTSDKTVNGIIKYTFEKCLALKDVSRVVVLNLYTVYETASGELAGMIKQYGYECAVGNEVENDTPNDSLIALESGKSDFVVAAWGKPDASDKVLRECGYFNRIREVLSLIKDYQPYQMGTKLRENLYPKHPRGIDYSWELQRLNTDEVLERLQRKG